MKKGHRRPLFKAKMAAVYRLFKTNLLKSVVLRSSRCLVRGNLSTAVDDNVSGISVEQKQVGVVRCFKRNFDYVTY